MKNLLLRCFLLLFPALWAAAQSAVNIPEKAGSFSGDTTLIHRYLELARQAGNGHPDSARALLDKSFELSARVGYTKGLVLYYHSLVYLLNNENKFEEALINARREVYLAEEVKDPLLLAKAFNSLANAHEYLGTMDSAGIYFLNALKIADTLKDRALQRRLNNNLSSVLYYTGDYQKGLSYARRGYELSLTLNDTGAVITSLLNVAGFESARKQYDSSLLHFSRVIVLARQSKNTDKIMDALNNMGETLRDMGRNSEALEKYLEMLPLAETAKRPDYIMYAQGNLGNTFTNLGRYQEAIPHLLEAIRLGESIHASNELQQWYHFMSALQEKRGDYKSALLYQKKYEGLKDSLMNDRTKQNVHKLEIQYRSAQKDKSIAEKNLLLEKNNTAIRGKNTWLMVSAICIAALLIIAALSYRFYRQKQLLHKQTILALQNEQQLIRLKAMMEGQYQERQRISKEMHDDIGSALTTILYLSEDMKSRQVETSGITANKIAATAGSVVDKMNEIIWSMNHDYDTLDDLISYSRQHVAEFLEARDIQYRFSAPDPVPAIQLQGEQRRNIYLVIKESLHNVVKHAGASTVHISFGVNGVLKVCIRDNGKGIDRENLRRFGNGLRNMKQRMESIGGSLDIAADNGTVITLQCPVKKEV